MKRREFIISSLGLSGLLLLKPTVSDSKVFKDKINSKTRFVLGDGEAKTIAKDYYYISEPITSYLTVSTVEGDYFSMDVPCKAHEVTAHPFNKSLVFGASKWGKEAYLADIDKKNVVAAINEKGSFVFNGHSIYSSDGQFIFMTMMDFDNYKGCISVRETKTYKEVRRIPTYGVFPHQLKWKVVDKVFAVINALPVNRNEMQRSLFNLVNVQTSELIKSYPVQSARNSHFSFSTDQKTAFIGRSTTMDDFSFYQSLNLDTGAITRPAKWVPRKEDKMECLSHIFIEEKSLVAMTLYGANEVVIWNYKTNEVMASFPTADSPRGIGISAERKTIYINFRNAANASYIALYHFDTFFKQLSSYAQIKGGNGSHLTMI